MKIQLTITTEIEYLVARLSGYWFLRPYFDTTLRKGNRLLQVRATQFDLYEREDFPGWIGITSRSNLPD